MTNTTHNLESLQALASSERATLSPYQNILWNGGIGFFTGRGYSQRRRTQLLSGAQVQYLIERAPETLLPILVELVPEVGYAVNQFISLCCDPDTARLQVMKQDADGDEEEDPDATKRLNEIWAEQTQETGDFHAALSQNFLMMLLSGMSAAEVVLPTRESMQCFPVNTFTLELVRQADMTLKLFQKQGLGQAYTGIASPANLVELPTERVSYATLTKVPGMVYPIAPFGSVVSEVLAVMAFMRDLSMAVHKTGFPRTDYAVDTTAVSNYAREKLHITDPDKVNKFVQSVRDQVLEQHRKSQADDAVVHGSEVAAQILSSATFPPIREIYETLAYRLCIALKIPPSIMGMMGTGRTEGWSALQWELFARQITSYVRCAAQPLLFASQKFIQNAGLEGRAGLSITTPHGLVRLQNAQAKQIEIDNAIRLRNEGLSSQDSIAMELTGSAPVAGEPVYPQGTTRIGGGGTGTSTVPPSATPAEVARYEAMYKLFREGGAKLEAYLESIDWGLEREGE